MQASVRIFIFRRSETVEKEMFESNVHRLLLDCNLDREEPGKGFILFCYILSASLKLWNSLTSLLPLSSYVEPSIAELCLRWRAESLRWTDEANVSAPQSDSLVNSETFDHNTPFD